jgi:hypothetical protein
VVVLIVTHFVWAVCALCGNSRPLKARIASSVAFHTRSLGGVVGLLAKIALICLSAIAWYQLSLLVGTDFWFIAIPGRGTILVTVTSILHVGPRNLRFLRIRDVAKLVLVSAGSLPFYCLGFDA